MTTPNPAWLEAAARAMFGDACRDSYAIEKATAALSVLTPLIAHETAERCAEICDREAVALVGRLADGAWSDPDERDAIESRIQDAAAHAAAIRAAFPKEG